MFIWIDANHNIIKQQLSFYGQVVEWNVVEGVKTGLIIEHEGRENDSVNGSEVVRFDPKPQKGPVDQALALLHHITALADDERRALQGNFEQSASSTTMPPEMFLERFEKYLLPKAKPVKLTWFQRLLALFKRR